jgi:hypothetical protein
MRQVGVYRAAHDGAAGGGTYADCDRWKCKSQEDYLMTDDRLSGSAKNIGGQVEEAFGEVVFRHPASRMIAPVIHSEIPRLS